MVDMKTILIHNENCSVRSIGSGLVIVCPHDNESHSLDEIGTFIWQRLDGQTDLDSILSDILREYDVDDDIAAKDLQSFVYQLLEAGLILSVKQALPSK